MKPSISLLLFPLLLAGLLFSCGNQGTQSQIKQPSKKDRPPGMVYIPGGTFLMGSGEKNLENRLTEHQRTVTVGSFYMDMNEIRNIEWMEFLHSVEKDSSEAFARAMRPDSTVFMQDLAYSEPLQTVYFSHPAFHQHPVVGVNWHQANEYCKWRTAKVQEHFGNAAKNWIFRLPTEAEWEYAARGLNEDAKFPWPGKSIRKQGQQVANLKSGRGDFAGSASRNSSGGYAPGDGYSRTAPGGSFPPNDYGLYDMAGNVSEWTLDNFLILIRENGGYYTDSIPKVSNRPWTPDPGIKPYREVSARKVLRGGSWDDLPVALSNGNRRVANADSAFATVGFRCVVSKVED